MLIIDAKNLQTTHDYSLSPDENIQGDNKKFTRATLVWFSESSFLGYTEKQIEKLGNSLENVRLYELRMSRISRKKTYDI